MRRTGLAICMVLLWASTARAKEIGLHTPTGRDIYRPDETFEEVLEQDRRNFVVEAVIGLAPEGNLATNLGWLIPKPKGLELYLGGGLQLNPSWQLSAVVRYMMNFSGYRPYLALGYMHQELYMLGTDSENLVTEIGYKWVLQHTYHFTLGVGLRVLLHVGVQDDSPLKESDVDPVFLREQVDDVFPYVPTLAFRFSRAF
jgi:hypothetical protein